jgi:hypothetical protein
VVNRQRGHLTMQNRYVGDIGDYVKLAILRALSPGSRLGVAWWLFLDENHNKDGRHIEYLERSDRWRRFDPDLFDALQKVGASDRRNVRALEASNILAEANFADEMIPAGGPVGQRRQARQEWFLRVKRLLADANLVFVDPDNGLEPGFYSHGSATAGKSVLMNELRELAIPGRCLLVYHHQTRREGGHYSEIDHWADRLRASGFATVDALRAKPYSPRAFFLLEAPADIRQRAIEIEERWRGLISWHPDEARSSSSLGRQPTAAVSPFQSVAPSRSGLSRSGVTIRIGLRQPE